MNKHIKELKEFCKSLNCDLVIVHSSDNHEVNFIATPSIYDLELCRFTISIGYLSMYNNERCICLDFNIGQYNDEQVHMMLALNKLTDEELMITPNKNKLGG